jgi:hypothetical protein
MAKPQVPEPSSILPMLHVTRYKFPVVHGVPFRRYVDRAAELRRELGAESVTVSCDTYSVNVDVKKGSSDE